MIVAALLTFLLPNQGYWFAGQQQELTIQWTARAPMPAADLSWELMFANVRLCGGTVALPPDGAAATIKLTPPPVAARTAMSTVYRLRQRQGAKELQSGDIPVYLFPPVERRGLAQRARGKKLALWDSSNSLAQTLISARIDFTLTKDGSPLALNRYDIILTGRDVLGSSPFAQEPLIEQARCGASVMVLAQTNAGGDLFGYALTPRKPPAQMNWRADHPLFAGLEIADLQRGLVDSAPARALRLPVDEPALEIAWWPRELAGSQPVPIDALLISKSIGAGRIVLCQLPLGSWQTDPRSQIFLSNAIDYLLTRPEPTPRPSQRPMALSSRAPRDENRIRLPGECP